MGADDRTRYDVPIALRDNESRATPNPWSRLEAVEAVRSRLETLRALQQDHAERAWAGQPAVVLDDLLVELEADLRAAIWGGMDDVVSVARARPLGLWCRRWERKIWDL